MAQKKFETPTIFGALCEGEPALPRAARRAIESSAPNAVLLPFQVEAKHLKNVIDCMLLMDVEGLIVLGGHRKRIKRHIPRLDRSAEAAGMVDTVVKRGRGFTGYCAEWIALSEWQKETKKTGSRRQQPSASELAKRRQRIGVELLTHRLISK